MIVCRATNEAARVLLTRRDGIVAELVGTRDKLDRLRRQVAFLEASAADVISALLAIGADPSEPTL
jgi:BMFP domain-containing protein YqiC